MLAVTGWEPSRSTARRTDRNTRNRSQVMSLQQLLGTQLPIIQAPMAGSQGSALAIAVCNAGGLGSLPCALLGTDAIRDEIEASCKMTIRSSA